MSLDNQQLGDASMRECPHHGGIETTLADIRTEIRAIRSTQDAMMLHLIPQQTRSNGNGTHISVQATGQQQAAQPSTEAYWLKIVALCLVILTAGSVIWSRVAALVGPLLH